MRPLVPNRRICLVLQGGLGDIVHGLPLVNILKADNPAREITWVMPPMPAPLVRPHPAVDAVIRFDHHRGLSGIRALRGELRKRRFDLVLNCGIYFKAAVPTFLARAHHKVGYGRDRASDLVWLTATHRLPPRGPQHWQDMVLEVLQPLGLEDRDREWRITITDAEREAQRGFFDELAAPRVVGIVTTSGRTGKDWSTTGFAEVATVLEGDLGCRVLLLGGPGQHESRRAREVADGSAAAPVWALGPDLRKLIYLIDGCDLLIAPDTGPLHVARALETPVIGLYGHTDPLQNGPYRKYEELVVDRYNFDAPGVPYSGPRSTARAFREGRSGRMDLISAGDVLEKVELALGLLP